MPDVSVRNLSFLKLVQRRSVNLISLTFLLSLHLLSVLFIYICSEMKTLRSRSEYQTSSSGEDYHRTSVNFELEYSRPSWFQPDLSLSLRTQVLAKGRSLCLSSLCCSPVPTWSVDMILLTTCVSGNEIRYQVILSLTMSQ